MFIAIHHNVTSDIENPTIPMKYVIGWTDACAVFFYFLITIIMHAVFQEYIFDVSYISCNFSSLVFKAFVYNLFLNTFAENFKTSSPQ